MLNICHSGHYYKFSRFFFLNYTLHRCCASIVITESNGRFLIGLRLFDNFSRLAAGNMYLPANNEIVHIVRTRANVRGDGKWIELNKNVVRRIY